MKKILLLAAVICGSIGAIAQRENFDIASFTAPEGWQRSDSNGRLAFSDYKSANGLASINMPVQLARVQQVMISTTSTSITKLIHGKVTEVIPFVETSLR